MHWADQCPHKKDNASAYVTENNSESDDEINEKINLVLMTEELTEIIDKSQTFVAEASSSAVIDTACTKTVASQIWHENFKSNLTELTIKEIETFPLNTSFNFGDGRKVKSLNRVIFPVVTANKQGKINAEIVSENIPLLLSKTSLKRCGTIINMNEDKAAIFGKKI